MDTPAPETLDISTTSASEPGPFDSSIPLEETPDTELPSPINDDEHDQPHKPATGPMQKRRRVTRACDECRRKKIKCDGKQPCTHCTVYSYECTYDQPSNRRRNAAPQYIEALETQLKRAKAILHIVFPNLDLNDPSIDAHLQNGILPQLQMAAPRAPQPPAQDRIPPRREEQGREEPNDSHLESMVKATGQLDLDEEGNWDYHGHSSGLSFMRRLQQQFGDFISPAPASSPFVKYRPMSQVFDSPRSAQDSPSDSNLPLGGLDLPSRIEAKKLCDNVLLYAGALMTFVHVPTFHKSLERIYDVSPENYGNAENNFLPLLYSVLALGILFENNGVESDTATYEHAIDEGFKYFKACRQLMDIADCRDLVSLQAIVYMIQFLQSSAKLSTCYAYIGVAQRSALRMGLHRSFNTNFNPIEAESRKRLFWVIRKMDTYVGAMLGLPHFLDDKDIDQDMPTEVDDEYITETEILPMPEGKISIVSGTNAHTRLVAIVAKICRYVYPIKGTQSGGKNSVTYSVGYSKIREIEQDLQRWLDELPMALKPGGEAPPVIIRVQQLLRMAFAHAQLLLYRPFVHYSSHAYQNRPIDQRAFACASACISVSRNIVHIAAEMRKRGLLIGAYWFSMYTTFFAVISLLYFVLENPDNPTSYELLREAMEGREVLAHYAKRSMAADRCTATLTSIFEKLPDSVKRGGHIITSKKRRQGSSPQSLQSRPNLINDPKLVQAGPRRASTFPESIPDRKSTMLPQGLPLSQAHLANLGIDPGYAQSPSQQTGNDFFDPAPSLTPTSTTTSSMGAFSIAPSQTPSQRAAPSFPTTPLANVDPTVLNVPVSDVSAMMFPSTDPFAYPNQPMTAFENANPQQFLLKQEESPNFAELASFQAGMEKQHPGMYPRGQRNSTVSIPGHPNDSDVQLLGPMPMYLMQGAQLAGQGQRQQFQPQQNLQNLQMQGAEGNNINFDDIFSGEEWANTFMDQGMGFGSNNSGYGRNPNGAPNTGMSWR